jgi:hypothetical protein
MVSAFARCGIAARYSAVRMNGAVLSDHFTEMDVTPRHRQIHVLPVPATLPFCFPSASRTRSSQHINRGRKSARFDWQERKSTRARTVGDIDVWASRIAWELTVVRRRRRARQMENPVDL